jgi:hypothetical protein
MLRSSVWTGLARIVAVVLALTALAATTPHVQAAAPLLFMGRSPRSPNFARIGIGTGDSMVTGHTLIQNRSRTAPNLTGPGDDGAPIAPQTFTSSGVGTKG